MGLSRTSKLISLLGSILCYGFTASCCEWEELKEKILKRPAPGWMLEQIKEDLAPFIERGISVKKLEETLERDDGEALLVHFRIRGKIVTTRIASSLPQHPARVRILNLRRAQFEKALKKLAETCALPNVDFLLCVDDATFERSFPVAIFAFAKNPVEKQIILFPDYDAISGYKYELEEVALGKKKYPWASKESKAYWRGATTGNYGKEFSLNGFFQLPRAAAVAHSLKAKETVNARFTFLAQSSEPEKIKKQAKHYFAQHRPIHKHLKYKYQLLIDGNTCAFSRAYWQLFSECPILKQNSPNIQWYYRLLKPHEHYIPVKSDLSDLSLKISWLKDHDAEAYQIGQNALELAKNHLNYSDTLYYVYLLISEYAKLQK